MPGIAGPRPATSCPFIIYHKDNSSKRERAVPVYRATGTASHTTIDKVLRATGGNTYVEMDAIYRALTSNTFETVFSRPDLADATLSINPTFKFDAAGAITVTYAVTGTGITAITLRETLAGGRAQNLPLAVSPGHERIARYSGTASGAPASMTPSATNVFHANGRAYRVDSITGGGTTTLRIRPDANDGAAATGDFSGLRARISVAGSGGPFATVNLASGGTLAAADPQGRRDVTWPTASAFAANANVVVDIERNQASTVASTTFTAVNQPGAPRSVGPPDVSTGVLEFTALNEHSYSLRPRAGTDPNRARVHNQELELYPVGTFTADPADVRGYRLLTTVGSTQADFSLNSMTKAEGGNYLTGNFGPTYAIGDAVTASIQSPAIEIPALSGATTVRVPGEDAVYRLDVANPEGTASATQRFDHRTALSGVSIGISGYTPQRGFAAGSQIEPVLALRWTGDPITSATLTITSIGEWQNRDVSALATRGTGDSWTASARTIIVLQPAARSLHATLSVTGVDGNNAVTTQTSAIDIPVPSHHGG